MTWKLTSFGLTRSALPGVPWRDLTDREYREARDANPGMEEQAYFYRVTAAEEEAVEEAKADEPSDQDKSGETPARGRRSAEAPTSGDAGSKGAE